MGNALADAVVDSDKCPIRLKRQLDSTRQQLSVRKKWADKIAGKVRQCFKVLTRHEQIVTGKNRPVIEKGDRRFVFKNYGCRHFAPNNSTENAVLTHSNSACRRNQPQPDEVIGLADLKLHQTQAG